MIRRTRISTLAATLSGLLIAGIPGLAGIARPQPAPTHATQSEVFSGIVEAIDPAASTLIIKTDVGKAVKLEAVKPDLLKGIGKGERITVETDGKNRARKIMKDLVIPEIKAPG